MTFLHWCLLVCLTLASTRSSSALNVTCSSPPPPFPPSAADIATFVNTAFDVIIIGGGTAGLTVASRLAENAAITVGVLEAGRFHLNDPILDIPRFAGRGAGNPDYDWDFTTTPQANADNRNISITRGKVLGGSSGLNLMVWGRASSAEYDAWEQFSSSDWSFSGLLPFFKRSENISSVPDPYPGILNPSQTAPAAFNGFSGPVQAGHNAFNPPIVFTFTEAMNKVGLATNPFPQDGEAVGAADVDLSVDHNTGLRSYAAKAYYCNRPARPNLKILTGAQATKIQFRGSGKSLVATGVQFSANSQLHVVAVNKEVVVSGGTLLTPQVLELSGIGNKTILSSLGIPVLLDLPQVGENLQEHLYSLSQYQLVRGQFTYDLLQNNQTYATEQLAIYNRTGTGPWASADSTAGFITLKGLVNATRQAQLLALLDQEIAETPNGTLTHAQLRQQRKYFVSDNIAAAELFQWSVSVANNAPPNESFITVLAGIMHPVSRGSVHITSRDPLQKPALDPKFLTSEFDQQLLIEIVRLASTIGNVSPLKEKVATITSPQSSTLGDGDLLAYIKETCANGGHLIGTTPMAPQGLGGVVDHKLKVYGTQNVRVVDASIIPLHIAAHTQATVYAIAEKAAEMIASEL